MPDPPSLPLSQGTSDRRRRWRYTRGRPSYADPIPPMETINDSVTIMRGCFGGCTFCSITAHQAASSNGGRKSPS